MIRFGVKTSEFHNCAKTGMYVDINGTGPKSKSPCNIVALRTDMDGLPMPENNPNLSYKTKTDHAHMCGHDGHMACLMAAAQVFAANRDKFSKGKAVRLLF